MNAAEKYDALVVGGGTAGKLMAWTMAKEGKRTAVDERKYVGGSCPSVACLPSKNVIHSAKVASLARRHREFGIETGRSPSTWLEFRRANARWSTALSRFIWTSIRRWELI